MNDGHCGVMTKMTACQQHQRHRGEEDDNDWFLRHIANRRVVSPHHSWMLVSVCGRRRSVRERITVSVCWSLSYSSFSSISFSLSIDWGGVSFIIYTYIYLLL